MYSRISLLLLVVVLFVYGLGPLERCTADDRVLEGLSSSDWSSIRAAYEANRHAAVAVDGGYQARNPGQQWQTRFDGRGFLTTPDSGGWSWGLELVSYGVASVSRQCESAASANSSVAPANSRCSGLAPTICATGPRVEYAWDESVTEWYNNDSRGLEHGYTMHRRLRPEGARWLPEASASGSRTPLSSPARSRTRCGERADERLQLTLAVRGDLQPRVSADGRGVTFVNSSGAAVVNYTGLTVLDANGRSLPAWFELSDSNSQFSNLKSQILYLFVDDSDAAYPLTIDPTAQQAYLKASNTGTNDFFGASVAVSGDTVVVGADGEDSNATGVNGNQANNSAASSGAAYVFVRSGTIWAQQAYLKPSNTGASDQFGISVSVSGDTIVVGAPYEDSNATGVDGNQADNSASASGAAYVFVRNGTTWSQQAYLKASNTQAGDTFGLSAAVSGDTVVMGAYFEDSSSTGVDGNQADNSAADSGAVYVFVRSGTTWSQQAYLKASNTDAGDQFGCSVAVSGDSAVVGAFGEDSGALGVNGNEADNSATDPGAAYVFIRSGATWSQQAYFKASNTGASDQFGISVSASGDTIVVGAPYEDSNATGVNGNEADNSAADSGAAYVFIRSGATWSQQAYLKASNSEAFDAFGFAVAASGDTAVVGAPYEDSSAIGVGGSQGDNSALSSGAANIFVRDAGGRWSHQAYLKASNTGADDQFGISVAVSGDTVAIGARGEDSSATGVNGNQANNSASASGAAYVFVIPADIDGDGVLNSVDVCLNNTPGLPVDSAGRPLSDLNSDCAVDGRDIHVYLLDPNVRPMEQFIADLLL